MEGGQALDESRVDVLHVPGAGDAVHRSSCRDPPVSPMHAGFGWRSPGAEHAGRCPSDIDAGDFGIALVHAADEVDVEVVGVRPSRVDLEADRAQRADRDLDQIDALHRRLPIAVLDAIDGRHAQSFRFDAPFLPVRLDAADAPRPPSAAGVAAGDGSEQFDEMLGSRTGGGRSEGGRPGGDLATSSPLKMQRTLDRQRRTGT